MLSVMRQMVPDPFFTGSLKLAGRQVAGWSIHSHMDAIVSRSIGLRRFASLLALSVVLLSGCGEEPLDFVEVKRIDEVLTAAELDEFLEVVRLLPEGKLPEMQTIYRVPVVWNESRTLPVCDLVSEELAHIERPWDTKQLAHEMEGNRRFQRALKRVQMTPEQFMGLLLAVGAAMNKSQLSDTFDFDGFVDRGERVAAQLKRNRTPFVDYSPDRQFTLTREAVWLYRVDRAKRLREVPRENVEIVRNRWEELAQIFPGEFQVDPLGIIADRLDEQGIPFEELPETGNDAAIQWNPEEALIGNDPVPLLTKKTGQK
jgi:hypothetical protein